MNIYCLYHIQAALGAPHWIPNQRPTAAFPSCWGWCPVASAAKAVSRAAGLSAELWGVGRAPPAPQRTPKFVSAHSLVSVCIKHSEAAVVMAQCRGPGWTNTEIKTKLTNGFLVQFFGSCAFQRKQYLYLFYVWPKFSLWVDEGGGCNTGRQDHILLSCQFYTVLTPLTLMEISPNLNWHQKKESMIFLRS